MRLLTYFTHDRKVSIFYFTITQTGAGTCRPLYPTVSFASYQTIHPRLSVTSIGQSDLTRLGLTHFSNNHSFTD